MRSTQFCVFADVKFEASDIKLDLCPVQSLPIQSQPKQDMNNALFLSPQANPGSTRSDFFEGVHHG